MDTARRRTRSDAGRRALGGRTLVALIATAALTLGPGALSAFAAEPVPADTAPAVEAPVVEAPGEEPAPSAEAPAAPEIPEAPPAEDPAPQPPADPEEPAPPAEEAAEAEEAAPEEPAGAEEETATEPEPASAVATKGEEEDGEEEEESRPHVPICHATGPDESSWVMISPSPKGVLEGHVGPEHQDGRDIIPPFEYEEDEEILMFEGQNWDATGQAIFMNDCAEAPPLVDPVITVTVEQCTTSDGVVPGTVGIHIAQLLPEFSYILVVTGPGGFEMETPISPEEDGTAHVEQPISGPGDYLATATGVWEFTLIPMPEDTAVAKSIGHRPLVPVVITVSGETAFTVNACPAPPAVVPELPITSSAPPIQALAMTGSADSSATAAAVLLLLGAGTVLTAVGARRALRLRG